MFATFFFFAIPMLSFALCLLHMYLSLKAELIARVTPRDIFYALLLSVVPILNIIWIIAIIWMFRVDKDDILERALNK